MTLRIILNKIEGNYVPEDIADLIETYMWEMYFGVNPNNYDSIMARLIWGPHEFSSAYHWMILNWYINTVDSIVIANNLMFEMGNCNNAEMGNYSCALFGDLYREKNLFERTGLKKVSTTNSLASGIEIEDIKDVLGFQFNPSRTTRGWKKAMKRLDAYTEYLRPILEIETEVKGRLVKPRCVLIPERLIFGNGVNVIYYCGTLDVESTSERVASLGVVVTELCSSLSTGFRNEVDDILCSVSVSNGARILLVHINFDALFLIMMSNSLIDILSPVMLGSKCYSSHYRLSLTINNQDFNDVLLCRTRFCHRIERCVRRLIPPAFVHFTHVLRYLEDSKVCVRNTGRLKPCICMFTNVSHRYCCRLYIERYLIDGLTNAYVKFADVVFLNVFTRLRMCAERLYHYCISNFCPIGCSPMGECRFIKHKLLLRNVYVSFEDENGDFSLWLKGLRKLNACIMCCLYGNYSSDKNDEKCSDLSSALTHIFGH